MHSQWFQHSAVTLTGQNKVSSQLCCLFANPFAFSLQEHPKSLLWWHSLRPNSTSTTDPNFPNRTQEFILIILRNSSTWCECAWCSPGFMILWTWLPVEWVEHHLAICGGRHDPEGVEVHSAFRGSDWPQRQQMLSVPSADKNRTNGTNHLFSTQFQLLMKARIKIYTAKTKVVHKDKMTMGVKSNDPKFWGSLASCYLRWCQQLSALNKPIAQLIYISNINLLEDTYASPYLTHTFIWLSV